MSYSYEDQYGTKLSIGRVLPNGYVNIHLRDKTFDGASVGLDAVKRQRAAQALAGDGYRVVPANVPHGCQWTDDPDDPCPVCGQKLPEWERELLAREVRPDRGRAQFTFDATCPKCDDPEPVDPASVRKGDHVEVTYHGWVDKDGWVRSHEDDSALLAPIDCQEHAKTVRILRAAEPEPDEAAVEALYEALRDVYPRAVWDLREAANTLARRNVRVVTEDA